MELDGKVVVVTGAASGIGRALARRFHTGGARAVVAADLDGAGAAVVAAELDAARPGSAMGVACDVGVDAETTALITRTEETFGEIDLFFANAGVGTGTDLETPDDVWATAWAVNWQAHLFAARRLLPGWLARGEGYFCSTASAAGLLAQIGSAPYSVTKHAAVALAEWLSITYGDRGVRVSCLCPMGVNTAMLAGGDQIGAGAAGNVVRATSEVLEPEEVAEVVVAGIRAETFLLLPHPDVLVHLQRKATDIDRWLGGMRRLQARMAANG
jgi:NAD(P)-dependent dehydrogenase (short-subunit alcohol dehydrogenase family)